MTRRDNHILILIDAQSSSCLSRYTFRNSGTSKFIVDRVIGHQDLSAAGEYGLGVNKQVTWEAMASVKMPIHLPALWKGE